MSLRDLQQSLRLAELDADRLRTNRDADHLRRQLNQLNSEHRELQARNLRLEQTAEILVEGIARLEADNAEFEQRTFDQLATAAQVADLRDMNDSLSADLETAQRQLDRSETSAKSSPTPCAWPRRDGPPCSGCSGTALESLLLSQDTSEEPLLRFGPRRTGGTGELPSDAHRPNWQPKR